MASKSNAGALSNEVPRNLATTTPTLRSGGAMLSKRHGLNFEIHNSVQLPTNPMIQGQPNVCSSCIRLSEFLRWQTVSYRNQERRNARRHRRGGPHSCG